ncbi:hypothetical protein [Microbulbifer elongatus]|uniref:hypothetical protein n=1 Tax=Microbulbifer elongatus TaxID=86173 RepID=UPI001CFDD22A|nr:hypothetical protein [Microbulbifer elongatus]
MKHINICLFLFISIVFSSEGFASIDRVTGYKCSDALFVNWQIESEDFSKAKFSKKIYGVDSDVTYDCRKGLIVHAEVRVKVPSGTAMKIYQKYVEGIKNHAPEKFSKQTQSRDTDEKPYFQRASKIRIYRVEIVEESQNQTEIRYTQDRVAS